MKPLPGAADRIATMSHEQVAKLLGALTDEQRTALEHAIREMKKPPPALVEGAAVVAQKPTESLGPVIESEETAWFSTGVRYSSEARHHLLVVSCDHCGASHSFETSERYIHPDKLSPRHIGEWMINHRRLHR